MLGVHEDSVPFHMICVGAVDLQALDVVLKRILRDAVVRSVGVQDAFLAVVP